MFDWLQGLPIWFQIVFSLIVVICVIIVLLLIIKKGVKIKNKDNDIEIGTNEAASRKRRSPHKNCNHNADILVLLNETSRILQEKFCLSYIKQMKDQMMFAETKIDQVRILTQKNYLNLLEQKGVTDLVSSLSYSAYRAVLVEVEDIILKHIRNFFRENHYAEMSEKNFQVYLKTKIEFIKGETTDLLNRLYFYKEHISREELYELNKDVSSEATPILIEIFEMARLIAIETKLKEKEYDSKLKLVLDDYI